MLKVGSIDLRAVNIGRHKFNGEVTRARSFLIRLKLPLPSYRKVIHNTLARRGRGGLSKLFSQLKLLLTGSSNHLKSNCDYFFDSTLQLDSLNGLGVVQRVHVNKNYSRTCIGYQLPAIWSLLAALEEQIT